MKTVFICFLVTITLLFPLLSNGQNCLEVVSNPGGPDPAFDQFGKYVDVLGVNFFAMNNVPDGKLLHAAGVLAQWIDNDEDGVADNPNVHTTLINNQASMVMFLSFNSPDMDTFINALDNGNPPSNLVIQDLYADETHPNGAASMNFDASLEECLHIVTHGGYSAYYPSVFGESAGSDIADAMDIARGGQFTTIPNSYPPGSWYTYDDQTCEYDCMVTEYFYWALTSLLGGQSWRCSEIDNEWDLCTPQLLQSTDPSIYSLLTDPFYNLPQILPDGNYCSSTAGVKPQISINNVFISPNPASDILEINTTEVSIYNLKVFDYMGRELHEFHMRLDPHSNSLDVSNLAQGVYYLQVNQSVVLTFVKV